MISDDELLLYSYDDGLDEDARARIGAALSSQPALAARLRSLLASLDRAGNAADVAVPEGARRRWEASLEVVANAPTARAPRRSRLSTAQWRVGLAAFGALALTIAAALLLDFPRVDGPVHSPVAREGAAAAVAIADDALRYERGLQWHLAQTEQQLAGLGKATREERSRLIERAIVQNRLFAAAAIRAKEDRLARVLRSFTPILESLNSEATATSDLEGGLAQLNFELKVMQSRLSSATGSSTNASSRMLAL
ncbi:MAG: hypothetical protein ABL931_10870 [Usitatibacteraceae bacterium]